jgi:transcriptional regulator with XRE-family HTH domain
MSGLKEFREQAGINQQDMAKLLGCDKSLLNMVESNKRNLPRLYNEKFNKLSDCLNKSQQLRSSQKIAPLYAQADLQDYLRKRKYDLEDLLIKQESLLKDLAAVTERIKFLQSLAQFEVDDGGEDYGPQEHEHQLRLARERFESLSIQAYYMRIEIKARYATIEETKIVIEELVTDGIDPA